MMAHISQSSGTALAVTETWDLRVDHHDFGFWNCVGQNLSTCKHNIRSPDSLPSRRERLFWSCRGQVLPPESPLQLREACWSSGLAVAFSGLTSLEWKPSRWWNCTGLCWPAGRLRSCFRCKQAWPAGSAAAAGHSCHSLCSITPVCSHPCQFLPTQRCLTSPRSICVHLCQADLSNASLCPIPVCAHSRQSVC